jgi:hypothetical protein
LDHHTIINKLQDNTSIFEALFGNIPAEQARWKPAPEKWSLLEVINHLYDEEIDDFRQRMEFALLKSEREWKRIAPVKWIEEKNYQQREMIDSLNNFLDERKKSVQWLKGLSSPDWKAEDGYPFGTVLTAEQVLANWLAHDILHIRQINALNWSYLAQIAPDIDLSYAGSW